MHISKSLGFMSGYILKKPSGRSGDFPEKGRGILRVSDESCRELSLRLYEVDLHRVTYEVRAPLHA